MSDTDNEPTAPVETGPTMEDTIRDTYQKLTAEIPDDDTATAQPGTESQLPVDREKGPDRPRGADGKFARAPSQAADEGSPNAAQKGPSGAVVQPEAKPFDAYPPSWKKDHEATWKALPAVVREEIHRREQNFLDGIKEYKQPAAFGRALGEELLPHVETMRRLGTTPQAVVRDLVGTWSQLVNGDANAKQRVLLQIARDFGIDVPARVASSPQNGATPPAGLDLSPVTQRIDGLEQALRAQKAEAARIQTETENARADSEIAAFAQDPKHEHFAAVQVTMGQLIQAGTASTLQDAYDKAVWLVPEVRAKTQAKEAEDRRAKDAEQAAAARKAAAANVRPRGAPPVARTQGTMEDTIRSEYQRLTASQ